MISLARHLDQLPLYGVIGACIGIFIAQMFSPLTFLRAPLETSAMPLIALQQGLTGVLTAPSSWWVQTHDTQMQLQALEAEITILRSQVASLQAAGIELEQLKKSVHAPTEPSSGDFQRTARLILGDQWALDVGEDDGVQVGDIVLAQGVFVGIVQETLPGFSTLSHIPYGSLRVVARTEADVSGVVLGEGGEVWLDYVSADAKLSVGDIVYTAGSVSPAIAPQLYIGTVAAVLRDEQAATIRARIDQGILASHIRSVLVRGAR